MWVTISLCVVCFCSAQSYLLQVEDVFCLLCLLPSSEKVQNLSVQREVKPCVGIRADGAATPHYRLIANVALSWSLNPSYTRR